MPRKRLISVDQALTRAIQQFQRHGYHASSIQNLEDCTGLGRGSLYNMFDSKRDLFITALRCYATSHQQRLDALLNQLSPRAAILRLFENTIDGPRDGCFLVNTSVELAPHDQEVAQIVAASFHEIEQSFFRLINHGLISHPADPALAARGLLGLYIALCVLVRVGSDQSALRDVGRLAVALLSDPNPT